MEKYEFYIPANGSPFAFLVRGSVIVVEFDCLQVRGGGGAAMRSGSSAFGKDPK